jgi:hypothetical protein
MQLFGMVIFTDATIEPIVPPVNATNQVIAVDMAVRHQCSAMSTSSIENAY